MALCDCQCFPYAIIRPSLVLVWRSDDQIGEKLTVTKYRCLRYPNYDLYVLYVRYWSIFINKYTKLRMLLLSGDWSNYLLYHQKWILLFSSSLSHKYIVGQTGLFDFGVETGLQLWIQSEI